MLLNCCLRLPVSEFQRGHRFRRRAWLAASAMSILSCGSAWAADGDANEVLLKKLEKMEQRIETLEAELKEKKQASLSEKQTSPSDKSAKSDKVAKSSDPADPSQAPQDKQALQGKQGQKDKSPAKSKPLDTKAPPLDASTPSPEKPILGLAPSPVPGLSIGAYGEIKFGLQQNPAANGQWQNGFDAARFVLLPTYAITDNIIFNAEIEFEHAGSGFDADDKLHGTAEIEQIWIDFKIVDQFNWRAPGVDLVPIGYINLHHEPTQFYSVNRPELYNGLIPSTWFAGASSVYGTIADGLSYQVQVSSSIEDFGGDFGLRTAANTVPPFPAGYMAGIDGLECARFLASGARRLCPAQRYPRLCRTAGFHSGIPARICRQHQRLLSVPILPRAAPMRIPGLCSDATASAYSTPSSATVCPTPGSSCAANMSASNFSHPENLRANNDTDPDRQCRQIDVRLFRRARLSHPDGDHFEQRLGGGAILSLHL